eukprot:g8419.t1
MVYQIKYDLTYEIYLLNHYYRIVSYRIISYRIVSYRIVSYRIVSYRIASYRIVWYRMVSYRIVSYRIPTGHSLLLFPFLPSYQTLVRQHNWASLFFVPALRLLLYFCLPLWFYLILASAPARLCFLSSRPDKVLKISSRQN